MVSSSLERGFPFPFALLPRSLDFTAKEIRSKFWAFKIAGTIYPCSKAIAIPKFTPE